MFKTKFISLLFYRIPFVFGNAKSGVYFQYVGTYNTYLQSSDMKVVTTTFDLTVLEDTFKSAKRATDHKDSATVKDLEDNLQKIFQIARLNHNDFASSRFRAIPANQLGRKIKDVLNDAELILDTLENLWKDSFEKYLMSTRYMFDRMNDKHLLNYRSDIEFSRNDGNFKLVTRQFIPHSGVGDLYKIFYTIRKNETNCFHVSQISDQDVRYLMIVAKDGKDYFMKIKNLDNCDIVKKTFLCDPRDKTFDEDSKHSKCLKDLFKNEDNIDRYCVYTSSNYNSSNCLN